MEVSGCCLAESELATGVKMTNRETVTYLLLHSRQYRYLGYASRVAVEACNVMLDLEKAEPLVIIPFFSYLVDVIVKEWSKPEHPVCDFERM